MARDRDPRILIVDDEVDICDMMKFSFEAKGFEAFSANDAEAAFELIKRIQFDVVVSDIRMPKGGGMKLLADIKNYNPLTPKVFLITGFSDVMPEDAVKAGAEAVFSKPLRLKDLVEEVQAVLG